MNACPPNHLPRHVADLLVAERRIAPSSLARRQRMARRLEARVGVKVLLGAQNALPSSGSSLSAAKSVLTLMCKWVASVLAITALGGALSTRAPSFDTKASRPEVAPIPPKSISVEEIPVRDNPVTLTELEPEARRLEGKVALSKLPLNEVPAPGLLAVQPNGGLVRADQARASSDLELARERGLLSSARVALDQGDVNRSLELLRRHEREFARGRHIEEREALLVEALRASGNQASADAASRSFAQHFPTSVLEERVKSQDGPVTPPAPP